MILIASGVALIVLIGAATFFSTHQRSAGKRSVSVHVPELSPSAKRGARSFEASCARCHGIHASGSENGPPLVHRIYEPSHHGDASIRRAVSMGVKPHHWRFGPMPRIDVSDRELESIIVYIRELQRANGIR